MRQAMRMRLNPHERGYESIILVIRLPLRVDSPHGHLQLSFFGNVLLLPDVIALLLGFGFGFGFGVHRLDRLTRPPTATGGCGASC